MSGHEPINSWTVTSLEELDQVARELEQQLTIPAVVILDGEMGAGKTTFVGHFVGEIFGKENSQMIASPTYSLINDLGELLHADLYRIEDSEEIQRLELPLYLDDKRFLFIEWGLDYLGELQSELGVEFYYYQLKIAISSDDSRMFHLSKLN